MKQRQLRSQAAQVLCIWNCASCSLVRFHNSIIHTLSSSPLFCLFFSCGGGAFKVPSRSGGEVKIWFVRLGLPKDTLFYSRSQITESASGVSKLKFENRKKKEKREEGRELGNDEHRKLRENNKLGNISALAGSSLHSSFLPFSSSPSSSSPLETLRSLQLHCSSCNQPPRFFLRLFSDKFFNVNLLRPISEAFCKRRLLSLSLSLSARNS